MKPRNRFATFNFHLFPVQLIILCAAFVLCCSSERTLREFSNHGSNGDVTKSDLSDDDIDLEIKSLDRSRQNYLHNLLHLSQPKIVSHRDIDFELSDGYSFDVEQEPTYPRQMGGINIKEEARKLATKLRILSNEEMGITSMQVRYDG